MNSTSTKVPYNEVIKIILIVKLTIVFLTVAFFQVTAASVYSQNTKISLSLEEVPFKKVVREIKRNSEFKFLYQSDLFEGVPNMSIDTDEATIEEILNQLIINKGFEYEIEDKTIIIRKSKIVAKPEQEINGSIKDTETGEAVIGATVIIKGTTRGTVTDANGNFTLDAESGDQLVISFVGYESKTITVRQGQSNYAISLRQSIEALQVFTVVGTRNQNRTEIDTPVPIDVLDVAELSSQNGKIAINNILQYAAPSFNATKQSGSDGADHIDPASLRGLGPDQTLVLINGKRRHQSSLVNIFGTRGRGNTGTDLNSIPVSAIKRIEVLRDGASAQYGSDAIAGVINIVLKDKTDGFSGALTYGAFSTAVGDGWAEESGETLSNVEGENRIDGEDKSFDGNTFKLDLNYGIAIGDKGGYANITTEYLNRERTLRPGFSWRMGYGSAAVNGFNFMINSAVPVSDNTEVYVFGGRNYRYTDAYAFSRGSFADGDNRSVPSLYPNGFTPRITSIITDGAGTAGIRHTMSNDWKVDFSNTYGINNFHYYIKGTNNASLGDASPTEFDAGGHSLSQNTVNLGFSKYYDNVAAGTNLAFGLEYRTENFQIFAGEEASYGLYDVNGRLVTDPSTQIVAFDTNGDDLPGGSQGFPGYSPENEVDQSRTNIGLYADAEFNLTESFLVGAALRFEEYSDFGETFNYKLASRYKLSEALSLRGSISSGFRAPSLAQIYYNLIFNNIVAGVSVPSLLSANNSTVTKSFGIDQLKEETAFNGSVGFAFNSGGFSATVDAYSISVQDRIILTEAFDASDKGLGVEDAQFFANGVDTRTQGIDIVLSYQTDLANGSLNVGLTGNVNDLKIDAINSGDLDPLTFFGPFAQAYLEAAAPDYKFGLNLGYNTSKWSINALLTQFSEVQLQDFQWIDSPPATQAEADALEVDATDVYDAAMTVDFNIGYAITEKMRLTIGGNNIFNAYPTAQFDGWTDQGGFADSVQMGSDGAYFFGRIGFNF